MIIYTIYTAVVKKKWFWQRLNILLISLGAERKFVWPYTAMQPIIFCMLMVRRPIISKQRTLKENHIHCAWKKISKDVTADSMRKTALNGKVYNFSVIYETIDANDIENIHRCLMKKHNIVFMPGLIKQIVIVLVLVLLYFGELLAVKFYPWMINYTWPGQLLSIWILWNFIIIHSPLVWTGVMGVITLSRIRLVKYVSTTKQKTRT